MSLTLKIATAGLIASSLPSLMSQTAFARGFDFHAATASAHISAPRVSFHAPAINRRTVHARADVDA